MHLYKLVVHVLKLILHFVFPFFFSQDSGIGIEDFSQPGSSFLEAPGGMFPTPGVHAPPTTPQDPPAAAYTPQPSNPPLPTPRKSPPQEIVPDWQPPPNPGRVS